MARSHLTLAALATSAVPELDIVGAARFGARQDGDYDTALLTGRDGRHWIIRAPRNTSAETEQSADLVALRALSVGVRTRLPFTVSTFVGQAPLGQTRAFVYEYLYGSTVPLGSLTVGPDSLAASIGTAIAAIHSLPTSCVADAGLPVLTADECLRATITVVDRAAATGLVPAALNARWQKAAQDSTLWQFHPTVINGELGLNSFLSADNAVTGVLGWQCLRVGDPARDLQWTLAHESVADSIFDSYTHARGTTDRQIRQRAALYAELEVAKWLLHGTEKRNTEIVDDAVLMLTGLVDTVRNEALNPITTQTMPTMAVDEVQAFLARNQQAV
ncbi:MAG: phosphotransferase [Rhodoglobus sp.]